MTNTPSERRALAAMYAGLGLTVAAAIVPYLGRGPGRMLTDHVQAAYPAYTDAQVGSAVTTYLILLSAIGALGAAAWLGTIWAVKAGRRWARPAATAMFVLGTSVGLTGLLTKDTSGDTGLPPEVGWTGMAPCAAGLLAVTLLWTRLRPTRAPVGSAPWRKAQ
ncbi:hypothetical protein ACIBF1_29665 [Spirillospora sp. NPDC050679]